MCGLTVIYSRIMGTAAWFSRRAAAIMLSLSRGTRGALARRARCSLSITLRLRVTARALMSALPHPPAAVPAGELSHTGAAEKPSPRLLMCCDQTMCVCPDNGKFRCEELSWPTALMLLMVLRAFGRRIAFRVTQAMGNTWCRPYPHLPPVCRSSRSGQGFAAITAGPGSDMVRKEDPDPAQCPLHDILPSSLE